MHAAENTVIQGVASRDPKRSKALNPITVHDSYEALINDPLIDAIYISLPNHLHCEWTVKALKAGKHVLCEKPFAMNAAEVELMIKTAKECDRLLVEAVWARWHPRMVRAIDLAKSGAIGQVISIDASFTFPASIEGNYRLSPEMGGGALFDIGVYPLHAIAALVNDESNFEIKNCNTNLGPTGIDLTTKWQMQINNSITANTLASFKMPENQSLVIKGEKQTITFVGSQAFTSWNSASTLQIGDATEQFEAVDPYRVMIEDFGKKVQGEKSWVLPLETSLWVQRVVDQLHTSNTLRKP